MKECERADHYNDLFSQKKKGATGEADEGVRERRSCSGPYDQNDEAHAGRSGNNDR